MPQTTSRGQGPKRHANLRESGVKRDSHVTTAPAGAADVTEDCYAAGGGGAGGGGELGTARCVLPGAARFAGPGVPLPGWTGELPASGICRHRRRWHRRARRRVLPARPGGSAVTVLEGSPRLGGKLAVSDVAGIAVDEGAEALLTRRPEGTGLIEAVGLAGQLVWPGTTEARIWSRGAMHPLPRRQFMGVPADLDELASSGLVSAEGMARARARPRPPRDRAGRRRAGGRVRGRPVRPGGGGPPGGPAPWRRLRRPVRGTVLRGHAARPGQRVPTARLARRGARAHPHRPGRPPRPARPPVFTTLAAGLGSLPAAVAAASGAAVRTSAMVRGLSRTASGWRLTVGSAHDEEYLTADAVVLAVPARPRPGCSPGCPGHPRR